MIFANRALRNSTVTCSAVLSGACPRQRAARPFRESHLNLLLDPLHFRRFVRRGASVSQLMVGGDSVRSDRAVGLESGQKETVVGHDGTHDGKLCSKQTNKKNAEVPNNPCGASFFLFEQMHKSLRRRTHYKVTGVWHPTRTVKRKS